jgi:Cofactor assembly of complex C subunit B
MVDSVVGSTLLLTLLLVVGLLFFIRASVKDRTQVVRLSSVQSDEWLLTQLKQYFADRAYQVTSIDADRNVVNLQGNFSIELGARGHDLPSLSFGDYGSSSWPMVVAVVGDRPWLRLFLLEKSKSSRVCLVSPRVRCNPRSECH